MYGSHMAMRTVIERSIMAKAQRPYGRSNHFGLNTDMGKYHTMDFADVLSDPYEQPQMDKEQIYSKMTKIYGLWVCVYKLLSVNFIKKIIHFLIIFKTSSYY